MAGVTVKYNSGLSASDPVTTPVLVIGQSRHLTNLNWEVIKNKLEPRVNKDVWSAGVNNLSPLPTDSISLYMNVATVAALPSKVSRHNTNSRSHSITKIVKTCSAGGNECIVLVCERRDILASGAAVARAFSLYSRKTNGEAPSAFPRPPRNAQVQVEFVVADSAGCVAASLSPEDIKALDSVANGIQLTARIVDTPCNEMHTDRFIEEIKTVAANLGIEADIIRGEELRERGFGGIYGVGKAAEHPPALVVLSHKPQGATKTIAWVGKGIVYDTGGLSIKAKTAMPGMKRDCGGAAAILGAFNTAIENGFDQNLHALFCLAENSVGPAATRPDDIHTLYSGRTVEINNTDAEGRLVLSDGVAYAAKDLGADIVLDMCTLTGAQGIATGRYHASHMSNRSDWESLVSVAGRTSGDLSFPAVYCPELHFAEFSSSVADMKNSVADRNNAQASCAGLFINANLGFDFPGVWLHVDMAAPAYTGERATGYGVALLSSMFGAHSKSSLLQAASPQCQVNEDHYDNGFTGSGFKLGADATAPSEAVEGAEVAKEPMHVVLKMWKDGFSIDDENIRKYDDPANKEFLQSVMRGNIPPELVEEAEGREVHVEMDRTRGQENFKPKTRQGNVLGSIAPSIEPPPAAATADPAAAEKAAAAAAKINTNVQPGVLLGMGNPLLDISAEVKHELLRKHHLKANDAILTKDEAIFEDMKSYDPDYIAGGATQNSIRVAQWILGEKDATAYFGCVGSDANAKTLEEKAREAGVNVQYQISEKYPTGRCAVLITGHERSLVTKLDAAEHYNVSHLDEEANWKTVEAAKVVYSAGFFLTVSVESMLKVAQHCADNDKTYCLNLAAPFLIQSFKEQMKTILPFADIVFGNETEAAKYAKIHFPKVEDVDVAQIAKQISMQPKENGGKGRIVILTQGSGPVIVVEHGRVLEFPVTYLPKNKIVDTNGAGDAFVGGFLAQYVQDKPLSTAVKCGIWAATQIIQRSGCTYDETLDYAET